MAAMAAVAGAAVGGAATYLADKTVVDKQLNHEETRQARVVRGEARIYVEQLGDAEDTVKTILSKGRLPPRYLIYLFSEPEVGIRQAMAAEMKPKQATALIAADQAMTVLHNIEEQFGGGKLPPGSVGEFAAQDDILAKGVEALNEFAQLPITPNSSIIVTLPTGG
jgi:hypothetical protein